MKRTERTWDKKGVLRSEVVTEEDTEVLVDAHNAMQATGRLRPGVQDTDLSVREWLDQEAEEVCDDPTCDGCALHLALGVIERASPPLWRIIELFDDGYRMLREDPSMDSREGKAAASGVAFADLLLEQVAHDEMLHAEQAAALSQALGMRLFTSPEEAAQALLNEQIAHGAAPEPQEPAGDPEGEPGDG